MQPAVLHDADGAAAVGSVIGERAGFDRDVDYSVDVNRTSLGAARLSGQILQERAAPDNQFVIPGAIDAGPMISGNIAFKPTVGDGQAPLASEVASAMDGAAGAALGGAVAEELGVGDVGNAPVVNRAAPSRPVVLERGAGHGECGVRLIENDASQRVGGIRIQGGVVRQPHVGDVQRAVV